MIKSLPPSLSASQLALAELLYSSSYHLEEAPFKPKLNDNFVDKCSKFLAKQNSAQNEVCNYERGILPLLVGSPRVICIKILSCQLVCSLDSDPQKMPTGCSDWDASLTTIRYLKCIAAIFQSWNFNEGL